MSKHFGKTWWGEEWLRSLSKIDYSNRLPRGSRYARNGSVMEMRIRENEVNSFVRGSRPSPYHVNLQVPKFEGESLDNFIADTLDRPAIVSALLNRTLSTDIMNIAAKHNLQVFPTEWSDLEMECSCPDWAVPCKHIAAVIYKLSMEIDNNPFLVFELHNVHLPEELSKRGITLKKVQYDVPQLESLLYDEPKLLDKLWDNWSEPEGMDVLRLEFSQINRMEDDLLFLLQDNPPFYNGRSDFKVLYTKKLKDKVKALAKYLDSAKPLEGLYPGRTIKKPTLHKRAGVHLSIAHPFKPSVQVDGEEVEWYQFLHELLRIDPHYLSDYQPSAAVVHQCYYLAIHLLAKGAIVPQIVRLPNGNYLVRWLPATLSSSVKRLIKQIEQHLQSNRISYQNNNSQYEVTNNPAENLLSLFLTDLVSVVWSGMASDHFVDMFFSQQVNAFNEPGEDSLAGGVQAWLDVYNLSGRKYKPRILVKEAADDQFDLELQCVINQDGLVSGIPLSAVFLDKSYEDEKFEILRTMNQIGRFIPGVEGYINNKGMSDLRLDLRAFTPFLMEFIPVMKLLDVEILLPKSLENIFRPKPTIKVKSKSEKGKTYLSLDGLLDFEWKVAIGDAIVDVEDFRKLLDHSDGLLKYKSQYIYVKQEEIELLFKHFERSKTLNGFQILRAALSEEYMGNKVHLTKEVQELIEKLTKFDEVAEPEGLQATLRPYQKRGYSWLYRNRSIGIGSVLADDMGLGKTLQVITALIRWKEDGLMDTKKALVVCPAGLLGNWQAEFQKFGPGLNVALYHGPQRIMSEDCDVLLTSYGTMRSDVKLFKKTSWAVLVIDEAQNIKNINTAQTKAIREIPTSHCIAMSGTPVENRLSELWSIMDFSNRGILGSAKQFRNDYAKAIELENNKEVANSLIKVTAPFIMRRLKSDKSIISDLPDKIEINSYANLRKEQAALYESTLASAMRTIEEADTSNQQGLFKRQGLILQMILALKQICNHPTQFLKDNNKDVNLSGKSLLLVDKLESIVENHEKVLIFTQFKEMGSLLSHFLEERFGDKPLFYHGGCTLKQREEMVQQFQHNRAEKIFILSLKAAGTGLNLTAANHVIHYDLWWNPAVEAQATDRAYRIGQKSNVMVHRFITKNTFEEKIDDMIQSKKNLADMTVASGESWIGNLSNKELKELFQL